MAEDYADSMLGSSGQGRRRLRDGALRLATSPLWALTELHAATTLLSPQEDPVEFGSALGLIGDAYDALQLRYAAKQFFLAQAHHAIRDDSVNPLPDQAATGLLNAALCDYRVGSFAGFCALSTVGLNVLVRSDLEVAGLPPTLWTSLRRAAAHAQSAAQAEVDEFEPEASAINEFLSCRFGPMSGPAPWLDNPPRAAAFADCASPRVLAWNASGVTWRLASDRTPHGIVATERLAAVMQGLQAFLAREDLCWLPTELFVVVEGISATESIRQRKDAIDTFEVVLPSLDHGDSRALLDATLRVAFGLTAAGTLMPMTRLAELVGSDRDGGLSARLQLSRPYDLLLQVMPEGHFERCLRIERQPPVVSLQAPPPELAWRSTPGPGYTEERARALAQVSYDRAEADLAHVLAALTTAPEFVAAVASVRADATPDWLVLDATREACRVYRQQSAGSTVARSPIPPAAFVAERLAFWLSLANFPRLRYWGLELKFQADPAAIDRVLSVRYRQRSIDVTHSALLPSPLMTGPEDGGPTVTDSASPPEMESYLRRLIAATDWPSLFRATVDVPIDLRASVVALAPNATWAPFVRDAIELGSATRALLKQDSAGHTAGALAEVLEHVSGPARWQQPNELELILRLLATCASIEHELPDANRLQAARVAFDVNARLTESLTPLLNTLLARPCEAADDELARREIITAQIILQESHADEPQNMVNSSVDEKRIEVWAKTLRAADHPYGAYLVLRCAPPGLLKAVGDYLARDDSAPPGGYLAARALAESAAIHHPLCAAGFALIEMNDPNAPVLGAVVEECARRLRGGTPAEVIAHGLSLECAALVRNLTDNTRIAAAKLAERIARSRPRPAALDRAIEVLTAQPCEDTDLEYARRDLAARQVLLERVARREDDPDDASVADIPIDETQVACHVGALREAVERFSNDDLSTGAFEIYQLLYVIPDHLLRPVAQRLHGRALPSSDAGPDQFTLIWSEPIHDLGAAMALSASENDFIRGTGLQSVGGLVLRRALIECLDGIRAGSANPFFANALCMDCVALEQHLDEETRLVALHLGIALTGIEGSSPVAEGLLDAFMSDRLRDGRGNDDARAVALMTRFGLNHDVSDLHTALAVWEQLVRNGVPKDRHGAKTLDNYATALLTQFAAEGHNTEVLKLALEVGDAALSIAEREAEPDLLAAALLNHANRLTSAASYTDTPDVVTAAIDACRRALSLDPRGDVRRRLQGCLATALFIRSAQAPQVGDLDDAITAAEEAYTLGSNARADVLVGLLGQLYAARLRVRESKDDRDRLASFGDFYAASTSRGAIPPAGALDHARFWMSEYFSSAEAGHMTWREVADRGASILAVAAGQSRFPIHSTSPETDDYDQAVSTRAAVDGIVGLTVLARLRAGSPGSAIEDVEQAAATIARDLAGCVPWPVANTVAPDLVAQVTYLRGLLRRGPHARGDAPADLLLRQYSAALDELRARLGVALAEPLRLGDILAGRTNPIIWIGASDHGGFAIRVDSVRGVRHEELPDLTTSAVANWERQIRPSVSEQITTKSLRGRGQREPARTTVESVTNELKTALEGAAAWFEETDATLLPVGTLASLPWQSALGDVRVCLDAAAAMRPPAAVRFGPPLVYADAFGDLPGALAEAHQLHDRLGAVIQTGSEATLADLADRSGVTNLHLALHGTTEPALWFADGPLSLGSLPANRGWLAGLTHMTLNCCTSVAAEEAVQDESLSIAAVAMAYGTRFVLVALWPIDDGVARDFALAYHHHLASAPPLIALGNARRDTELLHPGSSTSLAYQLLG